ncbi:phosphoribosylformylglycinamidine cyclo-ligase [candidate division KSB1 bacterium]|nr:phosphoribosylformylglycinamidine cyclo-ligase [candidate division KSB1 bacterium]RQW01708.1 MAG: phosphoribosylformylglycinamidine cyclo-ligase [candidate division KSB1 bacterium]
MANLSYKSSGVDLQAAEAATKKIASLAQATFNKNVLKGIGLFAGFYEIDPKYKQPVVVTSIDGVGTKLKIAFMMDIHETVGQDLVNHCVNDIMTSGADPLAFTDYIGTLNLHPDKIAAIVSGMAKACVENQCALIGGETAEMPGFYAPGEYDLAGSIIGIVRKDEIIDGSRIQAGDVIIGLPSTGLHTNGYSLARKVLFDIHKIDVAAYVPELQMSWGEALLKIHKSYKKAIESVRRHPGLAGISHITGSGIEGNTRRLLRKGLDLSIDWNSWEMPREFRIIRALGDIADSEMRRTFNLGIGLALIAHKRQTDAILQVLHDQGDDAIIIGEITSSDT